MKSERSFSYISAPRAWGGSVELGEGTGEHCSGPYEKRLGGGIGGRVRSRERHQPTVV